MYKIYVTHFPPWGEVFEMMVFPVSFVYIVHLNIIKTVYVIKSLKNKYSITKVNKLSPNPRA